jgi:uncharacterized RDD family membrane protein YckC
MDNEAPPPDNSTPAAAAPAAAEPDWSAGFWLRGGAYMIDGFALMAIGLVALLIPSSIASSLVRLLLSVAYFTMMPVLANGQTLGKMAAGIAIVRTDGSPMTYGRAFVRWLGYLLSTATLCMGFLCALFTKNKRALHDFLADTRVVRVEEIGTGRKVAVILAGFLLPIVIVLGIAAAIAIPQFTSLRARAGEGATKGRLGSLRASASIYYGDTEGNYPADLAALVPKYISDIPAAAVAAHPGIVGVEVYGAEVCSGSKEYGKDLIPEKLRDTGKWGYVIAPKAPCDGDIFIDCTHADSKGHPWYGY